MADPSETAAASGRVEPPSVENLTEARRAVEAMLMVASDPTPVQLLAQLVELPVEVVQAMCRELAGEYERDRRGFVLAEVAGGWRYQTHPDTHAYIERFALEGVPNRLSSAALETLAIVAYKQPISRGQIGAIRGVNVDGVLRTLAHRGYVEERGRDDGPGQATLFGTTPFFLEQLGLMSLDDLPPLGDFVPSAEVLEALEHTLKVGPDEIDLTDGTVEGVADGSVDRGVDRPEAPAEDPVEGEAGSEVGPEPEAVEDLVEAEVITEESEEVEPEESEEVEPEESGGGAGADEWSGRMEVAAEPEVEPTRGPDAIGAPGVDDADRFRSTGNGAAPEERGPGAADPGPHPDHRLDERPQGPPPGPGWEARPPRWPGPSAGGNGHRPDPGAGSA